MQRMDPFSDLRSHLEVRYVHQSTPTSVDCTPVAVFEVMTSNNRSALIIESDANFRFEFKAWYKYEDRFYPHPYTLRTSSEQYTRHASGIEHYQPISYEIRVYLELKRLRDFELDDLKRYYKTIDANIDVNEEIQDFHDLYLHFYCNAIGSTTVVHCNGGQPIRLPRLMPNPWTLKNTLTRFRYNAENRDGSFHCEMTLQPGNAVNLHSYKIVLCITSNTIPAQMDSHALRWICKLRPRIEKPKGRPTARAERERLYCLSHPSGIIIAQVFGPELKFTPKMLDSINSANYVESCFEPVGFQEMLRNSVNTDNGTLSILITRENDYPNCIKNRRRDPDILRYLPFDELDHLNRNLSTTNAEIRGRLKIHKDSRAKQLFFFNENEEKTFSEAHVRLHAAAYDENDVLLAEVLSPPLRNSKAFDPLRIGRIVQNRTELRANELAHAYCFYDTNQLRSKDHPCPFQFELVFLPPSAPINEEQLPQLFNTPDLCVDAQYDADCPHLLQFTVPNAPRFDKHRVFIRLRHATSRDYNPSPILLMHGDAWIYHADPASVIDLNAMEFLADFNSSSDYHTPNAYPDIELQIGSNHSHSPATGLTADSHNSADDLDHLNRQLNTPRMASAPSSVFNFPCASPSAESP